METIAVVAPFPNPHFLDIFESPEFTKQVHVDRFCFRSLPAHRQGLGWEEASFTKLNPSYFSIWAAQRSIADYSTVVYYGAIDPKCIPTAMIWFSLRRGQKTFLVSEGIRYQHPRWRSLAFSTLLNHSQLEILAIGDKSDLDYRHAGLVKPSYRKYGFFENYPTDKNSVSEPTDVCRILSVGQLIDRKNFLSVIYSLNRIADQTDQRIVYKICGEGTQRSEIEAEIKRLPENVDVELLGNCDAQALSQCFQNTDIFVMPSTYDGWGAVLNQAIHFRLPVIVSDGVRSARDHLVEDSFNGFIYDSDTKLDEGLLNLIKSPDLRIQFSQNCQEIADAWHIDTVARNLALVVSGQEPQLDSKFAPLSRIEPPRSTSSK